MNTTVLTRREFLAVSGLAVLASGDTSRVLGNESLALRLAVERGAITGRRFENRLTREVVSLPAELFALEFDDGRTVSSADCEARLAPNGEDDALELQFTGDDGVEVRVRHTLGPRWQYLRKQVSVRDPRGRGRRLMRADLENWRGVSRAWQSMRADRFPFGSHPIYADAFWAGVEFVAAFNVYDADGFTLRSRPGGVRIGTEWHDLRSTAIGVARPGGVREAFLRYIDDVRLAPARMVACYNSWWTLPKVVRQQDNLALIEELAAALQARHGVFFDVVTTDMGWSNPRSIWEIDPSILTNGFADIRGIVEPAGGRLGLWMSPSEVYPPVCDYEWARQQGYTVLQRDPAQPARLQPAFNKPGVSLADPRYREETKRQLARLIRENGLGHIKYDGFWAIELAPHHGLLPGEDSVEPLAAHSLELLQVSKEANPQLVTEPTYLNSIASYISPWLLKYSDTVWANGEDCVVGIGPAPDYRDSHTNAREFMVFQSLDQVWLPQDAVHYFDIVHVDSREGFPNHAAMAVGRGRFFLSTYLNPKLMSADDWRIYAGLLRWARANTELLRHTVIVRSRVEAGEPYAYGHWLGTRGIVVVRNPSNESRVFDVDLARSGAPAALANAVAYTQYPYRRGLATGLAGDSRVALPLAPWEVVFLEVIPQDQLAETVVIGARWWWDNEQTLSIAADGGSASVRVIEPGSPERPVKLAAQPLGQPACSLIACTGRTLPETEWLAARPRTTALFPFHYPAEFTADAVEQIRSTEQKDVPRKKVPSTTFEVECSVTVPLAASVGHVLFLIEFPGREHRPTSCAATVNGRAAEIEERRSDEHIGYYNWTGNLRAFESEWTWYICPLQPGEHRVHFAGQAGHPGPRVALWLWCERELATQAAVSAAHCTPPSLPPHRDRLERHGVCVMPPMPLPISAATRT